MTVPEVADAVPLREPVPGKRSTPGPFCRQAGSASSEEAVVVLSKEGQASVPRESPDTAPGVVSPEQGPRNGRSAAAARLALLAGNQKARNMMVSVLALLTGITLWHWATALDLNLYVNFENVPSPEKVFLAFREHLVTDVFYVHIGVSMRRIFISYCLAVMVGVTIGLLMGRSSLVRAFVMPYIEIIRPIPAVAWIPLAILMWPTEEASIIYITYLGALFPIVINTMHGVEQTPEVLVRAARSLGASPLNIFWHIVLPAALPSISAGLAIGMGVSWFSLLAGEIISGQYGIGYFTWNAYSLINYPDIVVGMLVIGFLGTLSTVAVKSLTRPFLRWQEKTR
jgi:NitT/TauT family transport system permease protein